MTRNKTHTYCALLNRDVKVIKTFIIHKILFVNTDDMNIDVNVSFIISRRRKQMWSEINYNVSGTGGICDLF